MKEDSLVGSPTFRGRSRHRPRPPLQAQSPVLGSPLPSPCRPRVRRAEDSGFYRSTSLETRSRSPSPNPTGSPPSRGSPHHNRSCSPSPAASPPMTKRGGTTRRLPRAPSPPHHSSPDIRAGSRDTRFPAKPDSLNLTDPKYRTNSRSDNRGGISGSHGDTLPPPRGPPSPPNAQRGNINFPRLNASPSRVPKLNIPVSASSGPPRYGHHQPPSSTSQSSHPPVPLHSNPPGRLPRPEPYSPTERNNLNKMSDPSSRGSTLPGAHRTSGIPRHNPRGQDPRGQDSQWDPREGREMYEGGRSARTLPHHSSPHNPSTRSPNPAARGGGGGNNGYPGGRHDDRFMAANQHEESPARRGSGRSRGVIVSNGFKPKGRTPEKYELRTDSNSAVKEDSDEDDDDWC